MKKNIIKALVVSGKYKDSDIEIKIGETSDDTEIIVNGKDISGSVFGVHIHMRSGQRTTLVLEKYAGEQKDGN